MMIELKVDFAPQLISWQKERGRQHLPWQKTQDPYFVWLSEIMLQQTQVTTVKQYYRQFTQRFPNIHALAQAPVDEVLALWSGLGYYARARNLHRCAQMVSEEYQGTFPRQFAELVTLPGIGPSTAAAISAFCYGERISILDGNVKRILTRILLYSGDLSKTQPNRELWEYAQALVPSTEQLTASNDPFPMSRYTQGLMDLGATLCLPRRPKCEACPMQTLCKAHAQGSEQDYPIKTKKLKRKTVHGDLLGLISPLGVWLVKRPAKGIWGGLYSFPLFEGEGHCKQIFETLAPKEVEALPRFKHMLTHLDWMLKPTLVWLTASQASSLPAEVLALKGSWYSWDQVFNLGLPAPMTSLLEWVLAQKDA